MSINVTKNLTDDTLSINTAFKKLSIANKKVQTKSSKKKLLQQAETLETDINSKIKSVALSKFIVRKAKLLKGLGKTKAEIDTFITDLSASEKDIISKSKNNLGGVELDKKFVGLSADDILKKVNAIPKKDISMHNTVEKDITPSTNNTPLHIKSNPDVDTKADIERNNEKIYDFLIKTGQKDIANYILNLMGKNDKSDVKKISDMPTSEDYKKLSSVNEEINKKLDAIEEELGPKQDTSISIPEKLQNQVDIQNTTEQKPEENNGSFIGEVLKMLLGESIAKLLMGAKTIGSLAVTLLKSGFGWLKNKISYLFKGMFDLAIKPFKAALEGIEKVLKGLLPSTLPQKMSRSRKRHSAHPKKVSEIKNISKKTKPNVKKLSKSAPRLIRKLGRFTKAIPIIGQFLAVGSALYSAQDGYRHADEILGVPKKNLTETDKLAAAAGEVAEDFTFGLMDSKVTAEKLIEWSGETPNVVKNKDNVTPKNEPNATKIDSLQSDVDFLKGELKKANLNGDSEKAQRIRDSIEEKNKALNSLKPNNQNTTAFEGSKRKAIEIAEKAHNNIINNKKMYDKSASSMVESGVSPIINSINGVGSNDKKISAFDLFDNF